MHEPHYIFDEPSDLRWMSEMIYVEGGTFRMGSEEDDEEAYDNEKPAHDVRLDSFYISKYPITQAVWETVMGSNPSSFKGANRPFENVSWDNTQEFMEKLYEKTDIKYRLPTEAEWEYATRGGKYWQKYPFKYSGSDKLNEVSWYKENSYEETKPVGLKTPNLLGLHDMSGNVWEWCNDKIQGLGNYDRFINESQKDPITGALINPIGAKDCNRRVARGGSWLDNLYCRVSYLSSYIPYSSYDFLGFRCVRYD